MDMESGAAKDLTNTTRRAPALLAIVDEPKDRCIRNHLQDVKSEPQPYRCVRDPVNRELWEQAMQQEFEGFNEKGTFAPAESRMDQKVLGRSGLAGRRSTSTGRL